MKRSGLLLAAALVLLMAAMALKGHLVQLPAPAGASANTFSAVRARDRLTYILGDQRPHPVDSEANDAVRARLMEQMQAVGLDPQVTDDFVCNSHPAVPAVSCARVRNLVATVGPREGRHVLAVAHYDSTAVGPGAADDGIGVAALLEIAQRLRGKMLRRPVTFLINEGEEAGLLGARAFMERHPIAGRVEALVNLEARGVEGPAIMFETSQPNGAAIRTFARTTHRPVANSLTADFYRLIPNSTDVTVFKERGWTTLNYAVIGNETRYHSAGDTIDALNLRSLQHMGDQALGAILGFANADAIGVTGQQSYADMVGRTLIVLPEFLSLALLGLAVLLLVWTGWRRRSGLEKATLGIVGAILGSAALAFIGQFAVGLLRSGQWWRGHPEIISIALGASALAACAIALILVRQTAKERLRAAFWLIFSLLGALFCIVAPGASILFIAPSLVAAIGMIAGGKSERFCTLAAAALLFLLFAPLLHLIEILLGYGNAWMFAPLAALILLPWTIELQPIMVAARPVAVAVAGGTALLGWAVAAAAPAYTEDRQQRFSIEYVWDADKRRRLWAVVNEAGPLPDGYSAAGPWKKTETIWGLAPRWTAAAPPLPVDAPRITVLAQREVSGGRHVTFRLSNAGARSVTLQAPREAGLRVLRSGGFTRKIGEAKGKAKYTIGCSGRSCEGATFDVIVSRKPVEWLVTGVTPGLPEAARPLMERRPSFARPQYAPDATITLSRIRL